MAHPATGKASAVEPHVAPRIRRLPGNVFAAMDTRVAAALAQGRDIIDLSKANPDLPAPAVVTTAATLAIGRLENDRYTPFDGKPAYLAAAADWYARTQGMRPDPATQLLATCGAVVGLATLTQVVAGPGDLIAVPDPYYPPYAAMAELAGAQILSIPTGWQRGYRPDFDAVAEEDWRRVRLLLLNYPNNPTGATADEALYEQALELAQRFDFMVANDFAYAGMSDPETPASPSLLAVAQRLGPRAAGHAVEIVSCSKMYGMAGWRAGVVAGPAPLMRAIRAYHHQMCSSPAGIVQDAATAALTGDQSSVAAFATRYAHRRRLVREGLDHAGLRVSNAHGALFAWVQAPRGLSGETFAQELLDRANVAVMPGECFGRGGAGCVRLSLLADESRLGEAVARISANEQEQGSTR